jgi:hypothetical protein
LSSFGLATSIFRGSMDPSGLMTRGSAAISPSPATRQSRSTRTGRRLRFRYFERADYRRRPFKAIKLRDGPMALSGCRKLEAMLAGLCRPAHDQSGTCIPNRRPREPDGPGVMRASIVSVWHFGQGGRGIWIIMLALDWAGARHSQSPVGADRGR